MSARSDPLLERRDSARSSLLTGGRAGSRDVPLQILREAPRRLGTGALIYAGAFLISFFGYRLVAPLITSVPEINLLDVRSIVGFLSILMALVVFYLSRSDRVDATRLLDMGCGFEVIGALGIAMVSYWGRYGDWTRDLAPLMNPGVPWEAVWILIFPLISPHKPSKILAASLVAASTGPVVVLASYLAGHTSRAFALSFAPLYFPLTSYLCAVIAFVTARWIVRVGRRLDRAREVGSYRLVRLLGKGGMGEVWWAEHHMLARPAAVKLIRPESLGSDEETSLQALRRFEREAQATAMLHSCHTIDLHDFGLADNGSFYYVMELLDGMDLDTLIKQHGPLPAGRVVSYMRQACHSLAEAHHSGLVHRDIKPANLYTCRVGLESDFIKVLDFGLVKAEQLVHPDATRLTRDGVSFGTPGFIAPEIALGKPDVDGRADLYALGCVAYWLLTGQLVFAAENPLAMALQHVQEPAPPPSQRTELPVPASLETVILRCLEKEPARRPQTAQELDQMLADCAGVEAWTTTQAREWWDLHVPLPLHTEPEPSRTTRSPARRGSRRQMLRPRSGSDG